MKTFLLIAGDNYYPQSGTCDWIGCYDTHESAANAVTRVPHFRTITKGARKGEQVEDWHSYRIDNRTYDWYEIVDLMDWMRK